MKRMTKILALLSIMTALFLSASIAMADTSSPENTGPGQQSNGEGGMWSDNFDGYGTGVSLHGLGGWKGWDNDPAYTAYTSSEQAASTPNSAEIEGPSDLVHEFSGYTSGVWSFTGKVYVPTAFTGQSYLIFLNTYADGGPNNWSSQIYFQDNLISSDVAGSTSLTLVRDQWLNWELTVDLDQDLQSFYVDGQAIYTDQSWKDGISGGGVANIGAIDLFANGASSVYYDDLMLMPAGPTAVQFDTMSAESNSSLPGALLALAGLSLVAGLAIWQRRTR